MKVLIINGSPRQKGNTSIALAEIAKQLEKLGIESEIVWIGNKPVRGCIACNTCKDKPGACVFDDDVCNGISAKMNSSDALIVGSPVYWGQPETLNMPFQMMSMPVVTSQYWNIVYGREPGQAALDREGLQTMRTLANNMAALLRATGGKPMPGSDEPWDGMHFIR